MNNLAQEIANAIFDASGGFSDSTSHRDMFRRVGEAIEKIAKKYPDFNQGVSVSQKLLNDLRDR